jgi:thiamine kinase-like enzyme
MRGVVDEVAARLWPGRVRAIEPLAHGITNSNYRIDLGDEQVVLRVPGKDTRLLGIDRQVEVIAGRLAASIGVAPELLAVDEPTGCLVTRFIEARPIPPAELAAEPMLGELVATLRRVHAAGTVPLVFDPFAVIHRYRDEAAGHRVQAPFDLEGALEVVDRIAAARPFRPTVFGHNDLLNANFLYDGAIRIVDWEYAGMTDPFFDLANVAVNHDFPAGTERALLAHYFGTADDALVATLSLMKLASELREAMWGVVQLAISALDVDFTAYATERGAHFAALMAGYEIDGMLALARTAADRR